MSLYQNKPIVIEAIRLSEYGTDQWDEVAPFLGLPSSGRGEDATMRRQVRGALEFVRMTIHTMGNVMEASPGDWIIRGVKDELYPCKPNEFEATYEPADLQPEGKNSAGQEL